MDAKEGSILLELERLRLNREQRTLVMDKGLNVYFVFLFFAILGVLTRSLNLAAFFIMVIMGLVVLLTTSYPYVKDIVTEKETINALLEKQNKTIKKTGKR